MSHEANEHMNLTLTKRVIVYAIRASTIAQTFTHRSLTLVKLLIAILRYIHNANSVIGIGIFGMYGGMRLRGCEEEGEGKGEKEDT